MSRPKRKAPSPDEWMSIRKGTVSLHGNREQLARAVKLLESLRRKGPLTPKERADVENKIKRVAQLHIKNQTIHDNTPSPLSVRASLEHKRYVVTHVRGLLASADFAEDTLINRQLTKLGHDGLKAFLADCSTIEAAIERAEAGIRKVVDSGFKRPHPHVVLLAKCEAILESVGVKVGLTKGNSPLVRFTRRVLEYATGSQAIPSFDRHIVELRGLKKSGADTFSGI